MAQLKAAAFSGSSGESVEDGAFDVMVPSVKARWASRERPARPGELIRAEIIAMLASHRARGAYIQFPDGHFTFVGETRSAERLKAAGQLLRVMYTA